MSPSSLVTLLIFLCFPFFATAQCLSGDCESGTGSMLFKQGVYTGAFANGLPNGQGTFGLIKDNTFTLDSIQYSGLFSGGVMLKGSKTIVANWTLTDIKTVPAGVPTRKIDKLWYRPENKNVPAKQEYPEYRKFQKEEYYILLNTDGSKSTWDGKIKKENFHGKGALKMSGSEAEAVFSSGELVDELKIERKENYNLTLNGYVYQSIAVADGGIKNFTLFNRNGPDTLEAIIQTPLSVFTFLKLPIADGTFKVRYKNGSSYTGDLKDGLPDGYGMLTDGDGANVKGYFLKGLIHGNAIRNNNKGSLDSGLFLFNKFTKGICTRPGRGKFSFPVCESGDCENGFGTARYRTLPSDTLKDYYTGNFVNGIPNGNGSTYFKNGTFILEKKGVFSAGLLIDKGTITANNGLIRKMDGYFQEDVMIKGRVEYSDGSAFDFVPFENTGNTAVLRNRRLQYAWLKEKFVPDEGTYYLPSGSKVTGRFNDLGYLVDGFYESPVGISMNMGHKYDANFTSIGVLERPYLPNFDIIATKTVAVRKQMAEETNRLRQVYAAAMKERERIDAINYANTSNPANYRKVSSYEKCGSCGGTGYFNYSHTFGRVIEKADVNNKLETGVVVKEGRTYNRRVNCNVCDGAGKIYISKEVYTGPPLKN